MGQNRSNYAEKHDLGGKSFSFVFEKVVLPVVQNLAPSDRLPVEWQRYSVVEDSFIARKKALKHQHTRASANRLCERCLEELVGHRPLYDNQMVLREILLALGGFIVDALVLVWRGTCALAVFCMAIWFVVPGMTPQEQKAAAALAERKRKAEAEARERENNARQAEAKRRAIEESSKRSEAAYSDSKTDLKEHFTESDERDSWDRSLLDNVNSLAHEASYVDESKLKSDDKLIDEANYLGKRMSGEKGDDREKSARAWNQVMREVEKKREEENARARKRAQVASELNRLSSEYHGKNSDLSRAEKEKDWSKADRLHADLNHLHRKLLSLECEYRSLS